MSEGDILTRVIKLLLKILAIIILFSIIMWFVISFIGNANSTGDSSSTAMTGLTLFEEPGDVMTDSGYRVIEVLENGAAIARSKDRLIFHVLLWKQDGKYYYDDQEITLDEGKCFRQIGIYKEYRETLPVVAIMDE